MISVWLAPRADAFPIAPVESVTAAASSEIEEAPPPVNEPEPAADIVDEALEPAESATEESPSESAPVESEVALFEPVAEITAPLSEIVAQPASETAVLDSAGVAEVPTAEPVAGETTGPTDEPLGTNTPADPAFGQASVEVTDPLTTVAIPVIEQAADPATVTEAVPAAEPVSAPATELVTEVTEPVTTVAVPVVEQAVDPATVTEAVPAAEPVSAPATELVTGVTEPVTTVAVPVVEQAVDPETATVTEVVPAAVPAPSPPAAAVVEVTRPVATVDTSPEHVTETAEPMPSSETHVATAALEFVDHARLSSDEMVMEDGIDVLTTTNAAMLSTCLAAAANGPACVGHELANELAAQAPIETSGPTQAQEVSNQLVTYSGTPQVTISIPIKVIAIPTSLTNAPVVAATGPVAPESPNTAAAGVAGITWAWASSSIGQPSFADSDLFAVFAATLVVLAAMGGLLTLRPSTGRSAFFQPLESPG